MNIINVVKTVVTRIPWGRIAKTALPVASLTINVLEAKAARQATIDLTKKVATDAAKEAVENALKQK